MINKVTLIGNLGADPEIRFSANGTAVANFRMATTESWMNRETGNREQKTEWHRIVVWGKQAETCKEYLAKGRQVYIEGRIQTRQWEDREGVTRYTTEIVAQNVRFLGGRGEARDSDPAGGQQPADQGGGDFYENDIPF